MKNILIISEYIAPFQAIGSVRWTKIAKYLKKGHEVNISILTINKRFKDVDPDLTLTRIDGLLKEDLVYFDDYQMVPGGRWLYTYFKTRNYIRMKKRKKVQSGYDKTNDISAQKKKSYKDNLYSGMIRADIYLAEWRQNVITHQVLKFLKDKDLQRYDVVISSYGPIWTHMVAEKIKKLYPNICWLADFRDLYASDQDSRTAFERHKRFTVEHCGHADYLIRVSDKLGLYQDHHQKVVTISNGYDPDEALRPLPPRKFNVVYTGTFYSEYDIGGLFHAFRELIDDGLIKEEDVVFLYAGDGGEKYYQFALEWGLGHRLDDLGIVKRKEALSLQQNAAILLMVGVNTRNTHCEWTGKMYEYMMAQKPIIYMMAGNEPNSLPSKDMKRLGGICYEICRHEETYPLLKDYILEKYSEWKDNGDVTVKGDVGYRDKYAYPMIAEQIWDLIR